MHEGTPRYKHDCERCRFLGHTLGNMHAFDLYVHERGEHQSATLVARYGDDGPDYLSIDSNYANPHGHAELYVAWSIWVRELRERE